MLSLLRLIFKTYVDLTHFLVFISYIPIVRAEAEPTQ